MSIGRITELRLTSFKSFRGAVVPLAPLTVLIGRNGSGKSNALDALEVLSRLAKGEEVRDALDGNRRDAGPVRGGLEGCAPARTSSFEIGVTVQHEDVVVRLDLCVRVRPDVQVIHERLSATVGRRTVTLLESLEPSPYRADLEASVYNGSRGRNPHIAFRSSHLLTAQLALRLNGKSAGERELLSRSELLLSALSGVFHLDPVPHLMRQYVTEQDVVLRRTGENLSAAVARLRHTDRERFDQLVRVMAELPEYELTNVALGKGGFGDVMLALKERRGRALITIPARQKSDGMLRVLAIATALLIGGSGVAIEDTVNGAAAPLTLVIEELENGLHPSQAASLLELVKSTQSERGFQVVITTHSPALLNALQGDDHRGVLVLSRGRRSGLSEIRRLVDLPGYFQMMAGGRLGDQVAAGRLVGAQDDTLNKDDLERLLGIG